MEKITLAHVTTNFSVICIVMKVFECLLKKRFTWKQPTSIIVTKHGFRKGRSFLSALLNTFALLANISDYAYSHDLGLFKSV